ncbi:MAG: asparagine synthase (glutamine-hydrolyzing), partial [Candidatus Bathyarchaeia archaeon]
MSVIDVKGGHQPLSNEDGTIWIIFNGEIYNYKVLQQSLKEAGHQFATNCDTEILIHLYEDYGTDFLNKLIGMFSFALWDSRKTRLFAARDRLGIKPFYYFSSKEKFVFASEIKSILECHGISREANLEFLSEYLIFRFVSGTETLFKGIKSLLPGHALVWEKANLKIWQYWKVPTSEKIVNITHSETVELLDHLLQTSVRRRLISDVPLGTLNSGGIDSSLITAYAAEMKADPINTYSVGFKEPDYDESAYSTLISQRYGTNHHSLIVSNNQFARMFPVSLWF